MASSSRATVPIDRGRRTRRTLRSCRRRALHRLPNPSARRHRGAGPGRQRGRPPRASERAGRARARAAGARRATVGGPAAARAGRGAALAGRPRGAGPAAHSQRWLVRYRAGGLAALARPDFRPVPGALDRPTEQLPVELREDLRVGAVQNQAGKPRDSHTETLPVGFATRQEQDVGLF